MSYDQELADAMQVIRECREMVRTLASDLEDCRNKLAAAHATIRDQDNQLAEKNATLERLQRERAEFWSKLNDTADHAKDR